MKLFKVIDTSFEYFDNTIKTFLSKYLGSIGASYTNTQIFGLIFNGIKSVMQNVMFYIEDAFTEQNILTATRKTSVYGLAKLSGYEPYYGSAATGTLIAKTNISNASALGINRIYIMNNSTIVNTETGQSYVLNLPTNNYVIDMTKPLIVHQFNIINGFWNAASFTASGFNMETFSISIPGLFDKNYMKVTVDGVEFTQAASLYDMTEDSNEFVVSTGYNNDVTFMFGSGIHGHRLNEGQLVNIQYITHSGSLGNVNPGELSGFVFTNVGYDYKGNVINLNDYITLSMPTCISGGSNSDSINLVRQMVGYNSRSLVLANEDNFKLFLKRFSFIGNCNMFSENNSMNITISCLKNLADTVKSSDEYLALSDSDMLLSEEQKEMVIETLNNSNKTFAGVTINFEDPLIRKYAALCYVKIENEYDRDSIKANIQDAIIAYFMALPANTLFIPKSDIISVVLAAVPELKAFDLNFISDVAESCYKDGYYNNYVLKLVNGIYKYVPIKVFYEPESTPGLDDFGNIQLSSKLEIPILHGGFKYYSDKSNIDNKTSAISIDAIQIFFI